MGKPSIFPFDIQQLLKLDFRKLPSATDVQDSDLLATYRSPGPLKKLTALDYAEYAVQSADTFSQSGVGAASETVQEMGRRVVYSDQFATVQQAVTAAGSGGTVVFPRGGTSILTAPVQLSGLSNITLIGYGHTVRCGASRIAGYFDCSGATNVVIEGFTFDGRQSAMPVYTQADFASSPGTYNATEQWTYNTPVIGTSATGATVRDCIFTGLYTNHVWMYQSSGLTVENCKFSAPTCNQTYNGTAAGQQYSFIYLQTMGGRNRIVNCDFNGTATTNPALPPNAVFYSGITGQLYIGQNRADYCARDNTGEHRLGVFDGYGDTQEVIIEGNICTNVMAQFGRISSTKFARVFGNKVTFNANCGADYSALSIEGVVTFGGQKGTQDVTIEGNTFDDPSKRHAYGVAVYAYDWGKPSTGIIVRNNYFPSIQTAVIVAGPFHAVTVEGNRVMDGYSLVIVQRDLSGATITSTEGTQANSRFDRLKIRKNYFRNVTSGNGGTGVQIGIGGPGATTAYMGRFEIDDNDLEALAGAGFGIVFQAYAANMTTNEIVARRNAIKGFGYHTYFRDGGRFVLSDNTMLSAGTQEMLDDGGYVLLEREGNRLSAAGARRGVATLVAGSVTVNTAEVRTGDRIRLTRQTAGGTVGDLSVSTITNATSFIINSSSASETSTVFWEIVH